MPTTPMYRVQTVVTGVAGSPYYIVGYFDSSAGGAQSASEAWHTFITGSTTGTANGFPLGSQVRTEPEVQSVNPVDGAILGIAVAPAIVQSGANPGQRLPPSNQILVRWRTGVYIDRREVRGRTNLPCGFEEDSTADGTLPVELQLAYGVRALGLVGNEAARHVIWSKKNGAWQETTTASVWGQFSILRSRRD